MTKKIAILGAGISGLAAAWFLKKKYQQDVTITLYEKSSRVGGWIKTKKMGDFQFEEGPRGFRPTGHGKETLELAHELGLTHQLIGASQEASKRYLAIQGQLHPFSLPFLLRLGLMQACIKDLFVFPSRKEDETIFEFACRRFNKKMADFVFDPLSQGIFGGDCRHLSMRSCLPKLWDFEQKQGSVLRGWLFQKKERSSTPLYSFRGGMEILPHRLAELVDAKIELSHPIHSLEDLQADWIISALPTSALAPILKLEDPLEYASITTVNLGWEGKIFPKRGYGFLVPSHEQEQILGMTWDSEMFPKGETTQVCVMIKDPLAEEEAYQRAVNSCAKYLNLTTPPTAYSVAVANNAIPQYTLFHHQKIAAFKAKLPLNLIAIGHCFDGIGVNDAIFQAKTLAT